MKRLKLSLAILFGCCLFLGATSKWRVSGNVRDMFTYLDMESPSGFTYLPNSTNYNLLASRLDLKYRPFKGLEFQVSMRHRIYQGDVLFVYPNLAESMNHDAGYLDLTTLCFSSSEAFWLASLDRLKVYYHYKNIELTLGRQRINWGMNLVWNPNDVFNTFSLMEVDYLQRPGCDALLVSYYPSSYNQIDLAASLDHEHEAKIMGRGRFNLGLWDVQVIGGYAYRAGLLGGGFSTSVGSVSVRGEVMGGVSPEGFSFDDELNYTMTASLGLDYYCPNQLHLHTAFLYNDHSTSTASPFMNLFEVSSNYNALNLSYGDYEWFGEVSYPVSPILTLQALCLVNLEDGSSYVSPNAVFSLMNNLDLTLLGQALLGQTGGEYTPIGQTYIGACRLCYSF